MEAVELTLSNLILALPLNTVLGVNTMKQLLSAIITLVSLASCGAPPSHEASMNFDQANVMPFIEQLNDKLSLNLDAADLTTFSSNMIVGEEQSMDLTVNYNGNTENLEFRVFKDDIDAPDLYFFSESEPLIDAINTELISFANALGI